MTFAQPHADEFEMSTELVRSLINAQFPEWASLPLRPFASAGSDHFLFRLGGELSVRLPRKPDAAGQTEDDLLWLPRFAGKLPLAIPQPVELGQATEHFPATWGVYRWLPGEPAERHSVHDLNAAAKALAGFIRALQVVDTAGGAAELSVAWNWLDADARAVFREALAVDDATWTRGKGWAQTIAAAEIPYYLHTNPTMVARSTTALGEVLAG